VRIERNLSEDGGKTNLLVRVGPEAPDRGGLVLSGHMDVVPAEEPGWHSDPFALTEIDGRYVGRGTSDMKGFLALAVNRFRGLDPASLRRPLVLLLTYDEEVGTLGARRFRETYAETRALPRNLVIGEPTQLRVVRAHKGVVRLRLVVTGRAAHSGYPHLGRSAIEPAARAIVALAGLRERMESEQPAHGDLFPDVPFVALNVGTVTGGRAANVIPDRCEAHLGIRVLPGMTAEDVASRVRAAIAGVVAEPFTLDVVSETPALMLDASAPIHRTACALVGQDDTRSVMYGSDAGWLSRAGFDCVLFGPGNIEVAHQPNEYMPADEFERGGALLDELIRRCCGPA
jgi:acetylornithine deacetylase